MTVPSARRYNAAAMRSLRRFAWLLMLPLPGPPALAGEFADEPIDHHVGAWWVTLSPDLVVDARRGELRPARAGVAATAGYQFDPPGATAHLVVRYRTRIEEPGAVVRWEVSWDGERYAPAAEHTWRSGEHELDFARYLEPSRPLYVRLALTAAEDPRRVAVTRLRWLCEGIGRVPAPPRWPPTAWLSGARVALESHRVAPGLPPGRAVETGWGRLARPLLADWSRLGADAWRGDSGRAGAGRSGRIRLLVAPTGPSGGRLALDGVVLDEHRVSQMPLGAILGPANDDPLPPLELTGVSDPRALRVVEVGALEIRYARARVRPLGSSVEIWVDAAVVNHRTSEVTGALRGRLVGPDGTPVGVSAAGHRFPPGCWLALLRFELVAPVRWAVAAPAAYRAELRLDDGVGISDAVAVPVAVKDALEHADIWYLNGVRLAPSRAAELDAEALVRALVGRRNGYACLPAPVDEAALEAADRLGVPVVIECPPGADIEAARFCYSGHPAVLAVRPASMD